MVSNTMELVPWLRKQLENEDGVCWPELVKTFVNQLMGAEADGLCGTGYGERSPGAGELSQRLPGPLLRKLL